LEKQLTLPQRLKSLDVFRGIAIASMILVNNPGSWGYIYPPLKHAEWHGCTPTDLIFPFFLFIVGAAMPFSLSKYTKENRPAKAVYWRIGRRALILFGLGLFLALFSLTLDFWLNGAPADSFAKIRIMGVLQRISLAYLISAIAVLNLERRGLWILATILLIGYWGAMQLIPVPGYGAGNLTPEGNLVGYIDRVILGQQHLLGGKLFDPEGLFSTLPAVVTVLMGYFTGEWLRFQPRQSRTSINLAIFGMICVLVGHLWGFLFPINKQLWTSSYVIFTAGFALLLLAACYELIEVRGLQRLGFPLEVMGLNAIFAFVGSGVVARILTKTHVGTANDAPTTYKWIYEHLFKPWAGTLNGSLLFAIATVCFWWLILYLMYRRSWYFKI
jgi:predicted acyltransferase